METLVFRSLRIFCTLVVFVIFFAQKSIAQVKPVVANSINGGDLVGRWDLTASDGRQLSASWLEVEVSGFETLVGRFLGDGGSARPIAQIHFDKGKFSFSIPGQWDHGKKDLVLHGELSNGNIKGTIVDPSGHNYTFEGVKAPLLNKQGKTKWGKPIQLFNGKNLNGWHASDANNQWVVENGVLISPHSGTNLISDEKFKDFKLHVEFRYSPESNSGIYLRGRYEVQIIDNALTEHPNSHLFGGVYGFLSPNEMASNGPNVWQTFDITLEGRLVTIIANGKTIICNQEIPGITGGALDSDEGAAGPIYFQGDHGPIQFRNVFIIPAIETL